MAGPEPDCDRRKFEYHFHRTQSWRGAGCSAAALTAYDTAYELKQNVAAKQNQEKAERLYKAVKDKRLKDTITKTPL